MAQLHAAAIVRSQHRNAQQTMVTLLELGVLPIVNENDTVAVDEIKLGDNDNLSALVASLTRADVLIILSGVPGLLERGGQSVIPTVRPEAEEVVS